VIRNAPVGLGEPCFDKLEAKLAHAMLSIPSTKAFEIGSGFRGSEIPGSKHNDPFVIGKDGQLRTETNWSGGVQGGISNGEDIYFRFVGVLAIYALTFVGSASSHLRLSRRPSLLPVTTGQRVCSRQRVATTPASCLVLCLSSRPWPQLFSWSE
jgi:hypothetical protein